MTLKFMQIWVAAVMKAIVRLACVVLFFHTSKYYHLPCGLITLCWLEPFNSNVEV